MAKTDQPVCPRCGYVYTPGDTAMIPEGFSTEDVFFETCVSCKQDFEITREISVTYSTAARTRPRPS